MRRNPPPRSPARRPGRGRFPSARGLRLLDLRRGPSFLVIAGVIPVVPFVAVGQVLAMDFFGLQMYAQERESMPFGGPRTSIGMSGLPSLLVDLFHLLAAVAVGTDLLCRWIRGSLQRGPLTPCSLLALGIVGLSYGGMEDVRADWEDRQRRRDLAPILVEQGHRALDRGEEREGLALLEQALRDDHRLLRERLRSGWIRLTSEDPALRDVESAIRHYEIFEHASIDNESRASYFTTEFDTMTYRALRGVWAHHEGDRGEAVDAAAWALSIGRDLLPRHEKALQEVLQRELFADDPAGWNKLQHRVRWGLEE